MGGIVATCEVSANAGLSFPFAIAKEKSNKGNGFICV